jgi:uncharacterized protein with von Willebrand factor type A (vWA) domain
MPRWLVEPDRARIAVTFARVLRGAGVPVPVGAVATYGRALDAVGVGDADRVYWAGRATLVTAPEQVVAYDEAFAAFFGPTPDRLLCAAGELFPRIAQESEEVGVRYSAWELLRDKDFAAYTSDEHAEARRLMADLRMAGALRRSRRLRPSRRGRGRPDVARTVRRALRAGGEPVQRAWRAPSERPRRVVLLCDVSGSMEPYARALFRFVHAAVASGRRVEAFALGTQITRLTRELGWRDPDAAMARAARAVPDWSGGTRLGEGLRAFNDRWGTGGMARGAVVVVLSDGWDRGSPDVLAEQMARLGRVAHRVVWVNPLKASPGYAPLAQGMAAALPYVDAFVEGHSLGALRNLAAELGRA